MKNNNIDIYKNLQIQKQYKKSWLYFLSFYKKNKKQTIMISCITIALSLVSILMPFLSQWITFARENSKMNLFIGISISILSINIFRIILDFIVEYFSQYFNAKMEVQIREELISKTHQLSMEHFDNRTTGSFISRVANDLKDITNFSYQFLSNIIFVTIVLIGGFIYIFWASWIVGIVVFFIIIMSLIFYFIYVKKVVITRQYIKVLNSSITWETDQQVKIMSEIQSYDASNKAIEIYNRFQNNYLVATRKSNFQFAIQTIIGVASNILITSLILIISSYGMIKNSINEQQLIGLISASNLLVLPLTNLSRIFNDIASVTASLTRIYDWISQKSQENKGILKPEFKGKITFKNVNFSYKISNGEKIEVFSNFNLEINPGDFIHFYGQSATGKSTFFKLLLRYYEIDSGEILIDDIPIKEIDIFHLRKSISYQSSTLNVFPFEIDNSFFSINDKKFKNLLENLKLEKTYSKKNKVDQFINSQGLQLSDSEKKMLSLLWVFYFDNNIVLLDSIDNFLDEEQILIVKNLMQKIYKNKTIVIMSNSSENKFSANIIKKFIN